MSQISRSSVNLDVAPGERRASQPVDNDSPFRILLIGDFSGRGNRGLLAPIAGRLATMVDRDNLDDVISKIRPQLRLAGLTLEFDELDDFHPDAIYRRSGIFQELAEQRHRPLPAAAPVARAEAPTDRPASGGSLLDEMIEESGEVPPTTPETVGDLAEFIKKIVAPHLAPREDPRQVEQAARIDETAAAAMCGILHHPDFQALEAAWRSVDMLVRGLDTDGDLKIYLFDATLRELVSDLPGTANLLAKGEKPWAVIVGNYAFGQSDVEAKVLRRIAAIAHAAGAPFLAESAPPGEPTAEWQAFRCSVEARSIGLALPRFLVRLPYGRDTSPIESFPFEEMPKSVHEDYLWANPAFCCAYLLGQSFLSDGWQLRPDSHRQVDGLPLHVYQEDGSPQMKPCAEILLTETAASYLMDRGIMALASMKDQDAVLLVRFQSVADPLAALAGRW